VPGVGAKYSSTKSFALLGLTSVMRAKVGGERIGVGVSSWMGEVIPLISGDIEASVKVVESIRCRLCADVLALVFGYII